jgi:hypothetical protein
MEKFCNEGMTPMLKEEERTLDVYKQIGAYTRLCKTLLAHWLVHADKVQTIKENEKLKKALNVVVKTSSELEAKMFREHAGLSPEYCHVFYGVVDGEPARDAIDAEILERIAGILKDLYSSQK